MVNVLGRRRLRIVSVNVLGHGLLKLEATCVCITAVGSELNKTKIK